jgi:hypothetical protein
MLNAKYGSKKAETTAPKVEEKPKAPVISIQDRVLESAKLHAAEIDAEIDEFIINKSSNFIIIS